MRVVREEAVEGGGRARNESPRGSPERCGGMAVPDPICSDEECASKVSADGTGYVTCMGFMARPAPWMARRSGPW